MTPVINDTFFPSKLAWFAGQAFLIFILAIGAVAAFSQDLPVKPNAVDARGNRQGAWVIWFDRHWDETTDPLHAAYYRVITYQDNRPVGVATDYYRDGTKQWEGTLIGDRPDRYTGLQTWYYENGAVKSTAMFGAEGVSDIRSFLRNGLPADPDWVAHYHDPAYEAFEAGDFYGSERLFREALVHAEAENDRYAEEYADIVAWLSLVYYKLGKTEQELACGKTLVDIYSAIRPADDAELLQAMHDVARNYRILSRYAEARDAYQRFLEQESTHAEGFHELHGRVLTGLGESFLELGQYDDAQRTLERAQAHYKQYPPEDALELELLNVTLSRTHFLSGQWTAGKKLLLEELRQIERQYGKQSSEYGNKLAYLGNFYKMNGQLREAQTCFTTAIALFRAHPTDPVTLLSAVIPLIEVYVQSGQAHQAGELVADTRSILRDIDTGDPAYAIMHFGFLRRLCDYYDFLGDRKAKARALSELVAVARDQFGMSSVEYIQSVSLVAEYEIAQGLADQARETLEGVVPLLNRYTITDDAREIRTMAKLAQLAGTASFLSSATDTDRATAFLEKSARIYGYLPEQTFIPEKIDVYLTLAMILETGRHRQEADALYDRCLREVEDVFSTSHPYYANMLFAIAKKSEIRKDIRASHAYYRKAIQAVTRYIHEVFPHLSTEEKERFYQVNAGWIENFKSFAVTNVQLEPSLADDLCDLLLTNKAIVLRSVNRIRSAIRKENDPRIVALYEEWASARNRLMRLYQRQAGGEEIERLRQEISKLEKTFSEASTAFDQWNRVEYRWRKVQSALGEGEAAVEIAHVRRDVMSDTLYVAVIITPDATRPRIITLGSSSELEGRNAQFYRNAIRFRLEDTRSYDVYWRPIARALPDVKTIYFSPDGMYHFVNVATLYNPETKRFVLNEVEINLVTSTAQLAGVKAHSVRKPTSGVIVAHPDYGGKPSSATGGGERSFDLTHISDLPGTQVEQIAITRLLNNHRIGVATFSEARATEEVVKQVDHPDVLHIATHGFFREHVSGSHLGIGEEDIMENPLLLSGLLLAGCQNEVWRENALQTSYREDGILTAFEASTLKLDDTQLVVLSACETGLGEVRNGEGVYGLQRAFAMAGAARTAMSLWKVDDEATREFMILFYSNWLGGYEVAHAFRAAQKSLMEKYPHPYYWGAFVLVGNR